jgi:hypothetical protein
LTKLGPFPPFIPQILKRESSEWLIQQIHENLREEYEREGLNEEELYQLIDLILLENQKISRI